MRQKLIVNAAAGRMGRRIIALAAENADLEIAAAVERVDHPDIGKDAGLVAGIGPLNVKIDTAPSKSADVMIDFSLPAATESVVKYCCDAGVSLVLGTTGLAEEQKNLLKQACRKIPVVYATNMSVGMNVLFQIAPKIAQMLGGEYDIEIIEAHHRFKKDAPSGSAITLAENIAKQTNMDFPACLVEGRAGKECTRQKNTIGIHAVRAGDITGRHSIIFGTLGETVTLSHDAHNRDNFARGALRAAKWLVNQKPGLYSMKDVLGF